MTPWVLRLIVATVATYFVTMAQPQLFALLALVPTAIPSRPWTVVTYMFVHAGLWHIFFNMLGLFFFGPRLEARLGGRSFVALYFLSGLGGALFSFLFAPHAAVVGASGAVFGVLLGFAYYWPRERIYIWGVLPVEARILVTLLAVVTLYSGIAGSNSGIAHFAHLGGFATGYAYLRWHERRRRRAVHRKPSPVDVMRATRRAQDAEAVARWRAIPLDGLHPLNRGEVERLLAKVEARGVASLTPDERAFLDRFSQRA